MPGYDRPTAASSKRQTPRPEPEQQADDEPARQMRLQPGEAPSRTPILNIQQRPLHQPPAADTDMGRLSTNGTPIGLSQHQHPVGLATPTASPGLSFASGRRDNAGGEHPLFTPEALLSSGRFGEMAAPIRPQGERSPLRQQHNSASPGQGRTACVWCNSSSHVSAECPAVCVFCGAFAAAAGRAKGRPAPPGHPERPVCIHCGSEA